MSVLLLLFFFAVCWGVGGEAHSAPYYGRVFEDIDCRKALCTTLSHWMQVAAKDAIDGGIKVHQGGAI